MIPPIRHLNIIAIQKRPLINETNINDQKVQSVRSKNLYVKETRPQGPIFKAQPLFENDIECDESQFVKKLHILKCTYFLMPPEAQKKILSWILRSLKNMEVQEASTSFAVLEVIDFTSPACIEQIKNLFNFMKYKKMCGDELTEALLHFVTKLYTTNNVITLTDLVFMLRMSYKDGPLSKNPLFMQFLREFFYFHVQDAEGLYALTTFFKMIIHEKIIDLSSPSSKPLIFEILKIHEEVVRSNPRDALHLANLLIALDFLSNKEKLTIYNIARTAVLEVMELSEGYTGETFQKHLLPKFMWKEVVDKKATINPLFSFPLMETAILLLEKEVIDGIVPLFHVFDKSAFSLVERYITYDKLPRVLAILKPLNLKNRIEFLTRTLESQNDPLEQALAFWNTYSSCIMKHEEDKGVTEAILYALVDLLSNKSLSLQNASCLLGRVSACPSLEVSLSKDPILLEKILNLMLEWPSSQESSLAKKLLLFFLIGTPLLLESHNVVVPFQKLLKTLSQKNLMRLKDKLIHAKISSSSRQMVAKTIEGCLLIKLEENKGHTIAYFEFLCQESLLEENLPKIPLSYFSFLNGTQVAEKCFLHFAKSQEENLEKVLTLIKLLPKEPSVEMLRFFIDDKMHFPFYECLKQEQQIEVSKALIAKAIEFIPHTNSKKKPLLLNTALKKSFELFEINKDSFFIETSFNLIQYALNGSDAEIKAMSLKWIPYLFHDFTLTESQMKTLNSNFGKLMAQWGQIKGNKTAASLFQEALDALFKESSTKDLLPQLKILREKNAELVDTMLLWLQKEVKKALCTKNISSLLKSETLNVLRIALKSSTINASFLMDFLNTHELHLIIKETFIQELKETLMLHIIRALPKEQNRDPLFGVLEGNLIKLLKETKSIKSELIEALILNAPQKDNPYLDLILSALGSVSFEGGALLKLAVQIRPLCLLSSEKKTLFLDKITKYVVEVQKTMSTLDFYSALHPLLFDIKKEEASVLVDILSKLNNLPKQEISIENSSIKSEKALQVLLMLDVKGFKCKFINTLEKALERVLHFCMDLKSNLLLATAMHIYTENHVEFLRASKNASLKLLKLLIDAIENSTPSCDSVLILTLSQKFELKWKFRAVQTKESSFPDYPIFYEIVNSGLRIAHNEDNENSKERILTGLYNLIMMGAQTKIFGKNEERMSHIAYDFLYYCIDTYSYTEDAFYINQAISFIKSFKRYYILGEAEWLKKVQSTLVQILLNENTEDEIFIETVKDLSNTVNHL